MVCMLQNEEGRHSSPLTNICTEAVLMPVPEQTGQGERGVPQPRELVLSEEETWQGMYKDNSARQVAKCNFRSHAGKGREKRED